MISRWILLGLIASGAAGAQTLRIVVVEGDGAVNNIHLERAKEPVIRVEKADGSALSGAGVHFLAPVQGPGASFFDGAPSLTTLTDVEGRAIGRGLKPNKIPGQFEIRVTASYAGDTATAKILQTNAEPVELGRHSSKTLAILAIVGG